jgi:Zn-dependent membrane protease YugP
VAGGSEAGEDVGRRARPLEGVDGKTAVGLLEAAGPVDRVLEHVRGPRPAAPRLDRQAGFPACHQRRGQSVEPMGAAAGRFEDLGLGLHGHHPLDIPAVSVARSPRGVGWQVGGQRHEGPGGLLAGPKVVLRLGEQVGERVGPAGDDERRGKRQATGSIRVHAALGQVAEPLVGMTLAHRAAFLDDRHHPLPARPQDPARERAAAEEVFGGGFRGPVDGEQEVRAEGEDAVHRLPGALHAGIESPGVAGVGQGGVDPPAEVPAACSRRRLHGRGGGFRAGRRSGEDREQDGAASHQPPARPAANSGGSGCVRHETGSGTGDRRLGTSRLEYPRAPEIRGFDGNDPMPLFFDPLYMLCIAPAALLAMWAQWRVHSSFAAAAREPAPLTGAAAARHILDSAGATDVEIEAVPGQLTDHYDPRHRVLRLSPDVYGQRSLAAVGIAAHEAGHALQDAQGSSLMAIRNAAVGVANIGSGFGLLVFMIGLGMALQAVAWLGIALFAATVFFQLVNLPVEIDASNRAKAQLVQLGIVPAGEMTAVNRVLNAAAWTYVAATLHSVLTLLYYASYLSGSNDSDR